jgi:hypothetical protein
VSPICHESAKIKVSRRRIGMRADLETLGRGTLACEEGAEVDANGRTTLELGLS